MAFVSLALRTPGRVQPSFRLALADVSVLVSGLSLVSCLHPIGFAALVPDLAEVPLYFVIAHVAGNILLLLAGLWLLVGHGSVVTGTLAMSLLGFFVYLVMVGFNPNVAVLAGFAGYCATIAFLLVLYHRPWDREMDHHMI